MLAHVSYVLCTYRFIHSVGDVHNGHEHSGGRVYHVFTQCYGIQQTAACLYSKLLQYWKHAAKLLPHWHASSLHGQ